MSYREIRNFTEIMRALGFHRTISMENFRKPNFELVAEILYWMVKMYDPETTVSERVEFENERVVFLTEIASLLATKARLKLNTKKLYASDGRAVQELLKLATVLQKATKSIGTKLVDDTPPAPIRVQDVKSARTLASDITQSGAKLYDMLANEKEDRTERSRALRFLDMSTSATDGPKEQAYIERCIRDIIDNTKQALEDMRKESEELEADERNLESKIKKKQEELERTEKRLKSLESVKPQFMEEAEKLEKELQRYYEVYMEKHRNLDYLEFELDKYRRSEEERKEEHDRKLKKMRERLYKEEVELMRGGGGRTDDQDDDRGFGGKKDSYGGGGGGGGAGGAGGFRGRQDVAPAGRGPAKVQGSMQGGGRRGSSPNSDDNDDESSDAGGSDSEREGRGGGGGNRGGGRGNGRTSSADSDDDEELSVNKKLVRGGPGGSTGGGRGSAGTGSNAIAGKGGAGGRKAAAASDDLSDGGFLDDDDDDEDGDEDGDDGGADFSGSDDF